MSKRNSIIDTDPEAPLRRSPRLLQQRKIPPSLEPQDARTPQNPKKDSKLQFRSSDELRRSTRLNSGVASLQSLRRSPRFSDKRNAELLVKNSRDYNKGIESVSNKRRGKKAEVGLKSSEEIVVNRERRTRTRTRKRFVSSVVESKVGLNLCPESEGTKLIIVVGLRASAKAKGGERKERVVDQTTEDTRVSRKRKRGDDGNESCKIQGWTKEQEIALQRAYYASNPTPHFWKKVAKLVPGKSAQDCFDRVHSDHVTPPQHPPRSRAKKMDLSSLAHFSLSASKLLKPTELKIKMPSCKKQKSHLAQKNVRQLLQRKHHVEQDFEADLFSVLEPNINSSTQVNEHNGLLSTPPKHLQEKQKSLQKCCKGSSGSKKTLSRFSGSHGTTLFSPPVLKQVKNRALHEKYIDRLHCREAKRKAASGKENIREIHGLKMDVIKTAKNALVTDAQNAINQFQHLHAKTISDSSDTDGNCIDCDDESETEI
ncbi:hypothetical protein LWI28_004426 [Acer negundo]|uniref:Myb-like domain-containing protein n=1 Tax=Acer negundo TaxID=4023 RepID=A0AAD5IHN2_ACENE|nr:hypothetical protein LWI28_004426 [Acer negundo]KAK4844120.1 hypothetical protein QYF36_016759 [Acer negundo]